jgi:hypothetical protein
VSGGAANKPGLLARWSWLLVLAAVFAAYAWYTHKHDLEAAIRRDFVASGNKVIDLPKSVPFAWSRVCVVSPYSNTKATSALLGFDWDSDAHSSVKGSDVVTLLVFADKHIVVGAVDYSRELAPWEGKCYPRTKARFVVLL